MNFPSIFKNLGHFVAVAAKAIVGAAQKLPAEAKQADQVVDGVNQAVQSVEPEAAALATLFGAKGLIIEKASFGGFGALVQAFDDATQKIDWTKLQSAFQPIEDDVIGAIKAFKQIHG